MKKAVSLLLALMMVLSLAACGKKDDTPASTSGGEQGKVFNIYAWNEEFKGFFEKYYKVPEGITVNWVITPNDGGAYQKKLDEVLLAQNNASADDKVDMFLCEADYITKYVNTSVTQDITKIGVTDFSQMYPYTVQTATAPDGGVKGVSFQCCPAALIYRRSIALDVLGTDDPDQVQAQLSSWTKYEEAAAKAKAKGYYMTSSEAMDYRVFSNNVSMPWVDSKNNLQIAPEIQAWMDQAEKFAANEYTLLSGIWEEANTNQMFKDGKTMCYFGPAWYFNFCMTNAQDPDRGCFGDWAICEGPQSYFWGGTWLLAATGSDNTEMIADIMKTFTVNEEVCSALVEKESQFSNNKKINDKFASDPNYGNAFLGGQNDIKFFCEHADNIKFQNHGMYDQIPNEKLQEYFQEYLKGAVTKEQAMQNFYKAVKESYPNVNVPNA